MNLNKKCIILASIAALEYYLFDEFDIDTDDSDSDEGIMEIIAINKKHRRIPQRVENYLEITLEKFTTKQFQQNFRITIEKYNLLLQVLGPALKRQGNKGRETINIEKQILSVIWLLATPDSFRSVGERFNLGKSSLSKCFTRVILVLCQLAPRVIVWPRENERFSIKESFQTMGGLPHIIGAVDGTFINIKAPKQHPEVYITRKCTYAITLQAISDHHLKFLDVFVGYPGSVGDNRIFRNSHIFQEIQNHRNNYFVGEEYIIGDKAYPLLDWCIPPYINRGNMTPSRTFFNTQHAKTRQTIERTFALLFGRFRRLKYLDMNRIDLIPTTVLAACVLHNLCLNTEQDDEFIAEGVVFLAEQGNLENDNILPYGNEAPQHNVQNIDQWEKREDLCRRLFLQRD